MKMVFVLALSLFSVYAAAEQMMKMNYKNEEITVIIENYSKASGQKFIVDSTVRGKITILNSSEVTLPEAFNELSEALALNGFAIITNGDSMTVRNARSAQRDNLEVFTTVPPAKPQRMVTWIATLKNISALDIQQQLRMLTSSYGEMSVLNSSNQLLISDWTSNIQRISEMIKKFDVPIDPSLKKIVDYSKKESLRIKEELKKDRAERPSKFDKSEKPEKTEN